MQHAASAILGISSLLWQEQAPYFEFSLDKKIKILTSRGQLGAQNQDPHEGKLAGTFGGKLLVKLVAGTFGGKLHTAFWVELN